MNSMTCLKANLGKDPEFAVARTRGGDKEVAHLRVAENFGADSEREPVWYDITVWNTSMFDLIADLTKGDAIAFAGQITKVSASSDGRYVSIHVSADYVVPFNSRDSSESRESKGDDGAKKLSPAEWKALRRKATS